MGSDREEGPGMFPEPVLCVLWWAIVDGGDQLVQFGTNGAWGAPDLE
jgi:hypothetical protein